MSAEVKGLLPWVGGKRLAVPFIKEIIEAMPIHPQRYVDPFVGGGSVAFSVLQMDDIFTAYNSFSVVLNDINPMLMNLYKQTRDNLPALLRTMQALVANFMALPASKETTRHFFYSKRDALNSNKLSDVEQAAHFLFLMRQSFGNIFRVNQKGECAATPEYTRRYGFEKYKTNLMNASVLLQRAVLCNVYYQDMMEHIHENAFVYLDPPYQGAKRVNSFYTPERVSFDDLYAIRTFCHAIEEEGAFWALSYCDAAHHYQSAVLRDVFHGYNIRRLQPTAQMVSVAKEKQIKRQDVLITNVKVSGYEKL